MAIAIERQIFNENNYYVTPIEMESGGVLSIATSGGINYAMYEVFPTINTVPLGIQKYNIENHCFSKYVPFMTLPYIVFGEIITNAIHIDVTNIIPGEPAYLAPYGTITNSIIFSTRRIGTFLSYLNDERLRVPGTLGPSQLMVNKKNINTAGWAKLRVQIV